MAGNIYKAGWVILLLGMGVLTGCNAGFLEQNLTTVLPTAVETPLLPTQTVVPSPFPTFTPTASPTATPIPEEPTVAAERILDQLRAGAVAYLPGLFGVEIPPEEGKGTKSWYTSMTHFVVRIVVTDVVGCEAYEIEYYVAQVPPAADDGRLEAHEIVGLNGVDLDNPNSRVTRLPGGGIVARWREEGAAPMCDELYLVGLDGQVLAGEVSLDEVGIQGIYRHPILYTRFLFSPPSGGVSLPEGCGPAAWVNPEAVLLEGAWLEGAFPSSP